MAEFRLTIPQRQAVTAPIGNLLVAAAAGSGKTAVLSQRVLRHLTEEPILPANRLLIVTFTVLASVEMRTRIEQRLAEKLEEDPQNEMLQRQQFLLSQAQISTIHSFCSALIRDQFQKLDLPRDSRIGEETEIKSLEEEVLAGLIEEGYASEDPSFLTLARRFTGKTDAALEQAIFQTYSFVRGLPFPKNRLQEFLKPYQSDEPFSKTDGYLLLLGEILPLLKEAQQLFQIACDRAESDPKVAKAYGPALRDDLNFVSIVLRNLEEQRWDTACQTMKTHQKGRLSAVRGYDPVSFLEEIKALRASAYQCLDDLQKRVFSITEADDLEDRAALRPVIEALVTQTARFIDRMQEEKRARSLLDYNDLEQLSLSLLVQETPDGYEKTDTALELSKRFDEIMVDECQDINRLQNLLFWAVAKGPRIATKECLTAENLFMVGDMKQSIYRFRGSEPSLFAARREAFPLYEDPGAPGKEAQILLSHNFRSRREVTDAVNTLFSDLFSKRLGGLDYQNGEELVPAASYIAHPHATAELHLVEREEASGDQTEPRYVAALIRRMVENGYPVEDHGKLRPCRYRDFCVLLRAKKGKTERYLQALREEKINCYAESTTGYFDSEEISIVLNLLRVLDNPLLDIPLFSVMFSPLFGFTPDELAAIRLASPDRALYFGVLERAKEDEHCRQFLQKLDDLRRESLVRSVEQTIRLVYESTAFLSLMGSMTSGEQRRANLLLLLQYAKNYDTIGGHHLEGFLRYVNRAIERGEDFNAANVVSEQADVVRVMSIHGSKGLEFPIVLVVDLAKSFNQQDLNASLLFDAKEGIALRMRRPELLQQYSTLPQETIRLLQKRELSSEELRILYVALTRAREKLILIGTGKHIKQFAVSAARDAALARSTGWEAYLSRQNSYLKWICASLSDSEGYAEAYETGLCTSRTVPFSFQFCPSLEAMEQMESEPYFSAKPDASLLQTLRTQLSFSYERAAFTVLPAKLSVTQLTKESEQEALLELQKLELQETERFTGAQRGTILHRFMQYADFAHAKTSLEEEISHMVERNLFTKAEAQTLNRKKIHAFFDSDLYRRIEQAKKIHREFAFFYELDANRLDEKLPAGERVLVQGIADLMLEEADGLVLVDYKTDVVRTEKELLDRYQGQVLLYREALREYFSLPVKESYLFSLHLERAVKVENQ